jgi:hypothetical protein
VNIKRNLSTSKELNVEFSLPNATTFGGALPVFTYMKKLNIENHFADALAFAKGPTATYTLPQICLTQVAGRLLGKERICHFEEIEKDPFLAREIGLMGGKLPDTTILYKDLNRFDSDEKIQMLKLVNDQVNLRQLKNQQTVILDFDSSVETLYGHQEKAAVGYNPRDHGKASLHPLLCFDGISHNALNFELRAGNAYTSDGTPEMLEDTLKRLPDNIETLYCRGDKGFGSEEMYAACEAKMIGYVIKMKRSNPLLNRALSRPWCRFHEGTHIIEYTEFEYQANGWSIPRRIIAVRTKEVVDEDQMALFPEYGWEYEWIVTNLFWEGEDIWRFYNHRCGMENYIKEAKNGFALDAISNNSFYPNAADAMLKLIAYNVYQGFKSEVAPEAAKRYTVSRMRRVFWIIPAVLVSHARQWTLKLWDGFAKQALWITMLQRSRQIT